MNIISTATNAAVGGYKIPAGAFEFPLEGSIGVITGGGSTNFVCASGDTLIVWDNGAALEPGITSIAWFTLGVGLVVAGAATVSLARRIAKVMSGRIHPGDV